MNIILYELLYTKHLLIELYEHLMYRFYLTGQFASWNFSKLQKQCLVFFCYRCWNLYASDIFCLNIWKLQTESRWISYSFKPKQVRWGSFSLNTRKHTRHIFKYAVAKKQIFARRTFLELRTVGKSCRLSVGVGVSNPV